jgi:hypothetical protein
MKTAMTPNNSAKPIITRVLARMKRNPSPALAQTARANPITVTTATDSITNEMKPLHSVLNAL